MAWWVPDSGVTFLAICQKKDHLGPNFWKRISGNIFDHEEDTLGIILSSISGRPGIGPGQPLDSGGLFIMSRLVYSWRIIRAFSAMCIFKHTSTKFGIFLKISMSFQLILIIILASSFKSIAYSAYICKKKPKKGLFDETHHAFSRLAYSVIFLRQLENYRYSVAGITKFLSGDFSMELWILSL